jgi:hypothetical protein
MISIILVLLIIIFLILRRPVEKYAYKSYLLTIPSAHERREVFFQYATQPVEVVYGKDTRDVATARTFEHMVQPEFFNKAVEMHYDSDVARPNMSYFNMGAIGCYFGHMEILNKAVNDKVKYALIFEDNAVVKSPKLYDEVQKVIDARGDNFEACFFHCLSYLPAPENKEKVLWISSTKCYLVHVPNMKKYLPTFIPMNNHVDLKFEDIIAKGARVYYRDMRKYLAIDRSHQSTIGHRGEEDEEFFSRQYPKVPRSKLVSGW